MKNIQEAENKLEEILNSDVIETSKMDNLATWYQKYTDYMLVEFELKLANSENEHKNEQHDTHNKFKASIDKNKYLKYISEIKKSEIIQQEINQIIEDILKKHNAVDFEKLQEEFPDLMNTLILLDDKLSKQFVHAINKFLGDIEPKKLE